MTKYQFDGNWEFELQLHELNKFNFEKNTNSIKIVVRDFLDDETEPFNEQIDAINYLIEHEDKIAALILNTVWDNWKEINEDHSIDEWEDDFPKIETAEDLSKIIRIDTCYIQPLHKDGFSYIGIEGNCLWDEEHGLGFIIHKNRMIEFGGAEEADASGSEVKDHPDNVRPKEPEFLKLYEAHPIYQTLKPAHQEANIHYPHKLIERGMNSDFFNYLKSGIDVDYIALGDFQKRTFLMSACFYNNEKVFNFLIDKVSNLSGAIHEAHKRKNITFLERLIEVGANINQEKFGNNIYTLAIEEYLGLISVNLHSDQMDENQKRMINFYNSMGIPLDKNIIVKERVTHPKIKIAQLKKYIEWLKANNMNYNPQKIEHIKHNHQNNKRALNAIEKELQSIEAEN